MCFPFPEYPVTFLTRKGGEKEREYVREGLTRGHWCVMALKLADPKEFSPEMMAST